MNTSPSWLTTGIRAVLFVVFTFVLAHNILYIYIQPVLQPSGLSGSVDIILFIFGLGAIVSLWIVGALVDRRLQSLVVASVLFFGSAAALIGFLGDVAQIIYLTAIVWGLAFGGFATITQTSLSRFAGSSVDVAQAMYTTGWNTAVAAGGVAGGLLLDRTGTSAFPWIVLGILVIAFASVVGAMNRAPPHRV
ncbi:MFS transporter [Aquabacter sp. CN5-332]|uniref:MFS transporter n=1 Tax=Aquabacter sp. CN5-332 TaxID=3156608 RepID=UPI0032B35AC2